MYIGLMINISQYITKCNSVPYIMVTYFYAVTPGMNSNKMILNRTYVPTCQTYMALKS